MYVLYKISKIDTGGGFGDRCKNLHYGGSTGLSNKLDQFNSDLFNFLNYIK